MDDQDLHQQHAGVESQVCRLLGLYYVCHQEQGSLETALLLPDDEEVEVDEAFEGYFPYML